MSKQTIYPLGSRLIAFVSFDETCTVVDCPPQYSYCDSADKIWVIFDNKEKWGDGVVYHLNSHNYRLRLINIDVGDEEDDL